MQQYATPRLEEIKPYRGFSDLENYLDDLRKKFISEDIHVQETDIAYIVQFAREMHKEWLSKAANQIRWKETSDTVWLKANEGTDRVMVVTENGKTFQSAVISKCTFDQLPLDWQIENIEDLFQSFRLVSEIYKSGGNLTAEIKEDLSKKLHEAWRIRKKVQFSEKQYPKYEDIPAEERQNNNQYRIERTEEMMQRLRFLNSELKEMEDGSETLRSKYESIAKQLDTPIPDRYPESWNHPDLSKIKFTKAEIQKWKDNGMIGSDLMHMILRKRETSIEPKLWLAERIKLFEKLNEKNELAQIIFQRHEEIIQWINQDPHITIDQIISKLVEDLPNKEELLKHQGDVGGMSIYPVHPNTIDTRNPNPKPIPLSDYRGKDSYHPDIEEFLEEGINIPLTKDINNNDELTFYTGFYWKNGAGNPAADMLLGAITFDENMVPSFSALMIEPAVYPGYLACVGGMREGENWVSRRGIIDNALRELEEEAGLKFTSDMTLDMGSADEIVREQRITPFAYVTSRPVFLIVPSNVTLKAKADSDSLESGMRIINENTLLKFHNPTHVKFMMELLMAFEKKNPGLTVGAEGRVYLKKGIEINPIDGKMMLKPGYIMDEDTGEIKLTESMQSLENLTKKFNRQDKFAFAELSQILPLPQYANELYQLFNTEYSDKLQVWGQVTIPNPNYDDRALIERWVKVGAGVGKFFIQQRENGLFICRAYYEAAPRAVELIDLPKHFDTIEAKRTFISEHIVKGIKNDPRYSELFTDLTGIISAIGGATLIDMETEIAISGAFQLLGIYIQEALEGKIAIIDGGTDSGVMRANAQTELRLKDKLTSIGITPLGGMTKWLQKLEANHDLSLVVDEDDFGGETEFMMIFLEELIKQCQVKTAFTILANGGLITIKELFGTLRSNRKIIMLEDSGRSCEILTSLIRNKSFNVNQLKAFNKRGTVRNNSADEIKDHKKNLKLIVEQLKLLYTDLSQDIDRCVEVDGDTIVGLDLTKCEVVVQRLKDRFILAKCTDTQSLKEAIRIAIAN